MVEYIDLGSPRYEAFSSTSMRRKRDLYIVRDGRGALNTYSRFVQHSYSAYSF